jgi:hypothetical protein
MLSGSPMAWASPAPLVAYIGVGAILGWVIRKYSAREAINNPLAFGAYLAWSIVSSIFITTLALCTLDSKDWGTRTKEQEVADGDNTPQETAV